MHLATLIGDVVASRSTPDRSALHDRLTTALAVVNEQFTPLHELRLTIGDEYQGAFAEIGTAVRATMRLRLELAPDDVRHGIGWGEVDVLQSEPPVEDGPGWWAARAAIEAVHADQERSATRWRRTAFRSDDPEVVVLGKALEAGLVLRDQALARLDHRGLSVLSGMLAGRSQQQISEELQVSASAVSQRVRADGLAALVAADLAWGEPDREQP